MDSLSSPNSKHRRTRIAWLIGGIVLMGVGMMAGSSWDKIRVLYYTYQLKNRFEEISTPIHLQRETVSAREEILEPLIKIGQPTVPGLVELFNTGVPPVQQAAAFTLSHIEKTGIGVLEGHIEGKKKSLRVYVAELVHGSSGNTKYQGLFKKLLSDPDEEVRVAIFWYVYNWAPNEVPPQITESLKQLKIPSFIEYQIKKLNPKGQKWEYKVRLKMEALHEFEKLASYGIPFDNAVPEIAKRLDDLDSSVKFKAAHVLTISGNTTPESKKKISELLKNWSPELDPETKKKLNDLFKELGG